MYSSHCETDGLNCQFLIRPNRSLTRRGVLLFFLLIIFLSSLIAIRYFLLGAWLVLPFTMMELVVLGFSFYLYRRATRRYELVTLNDKSLEIVRQELQGREEWSFQTYWAQVVLLPDPTSWYPSRLFVRSHGKAVEIGNYLTDSEREQLAEDLKRALAMGKEKRFE